MYNKPALPATGAFSLLGFTVFHYNAIILVLGLGLLAFTVYNLLTLISKERS